MGRQSRHSFNSAGLHDVAIVDAKSDRMAQALRDRVKPLAGRLRQKRVPVGTVSCLIVAESPRRPPKHEGDTSKIVPAIRVASSAARIRLIVAEPPSGWESGRRQRRYLVRNGAPTKGGGRGDDLSAAAGTGDPTALGDTDGAAQGADAASAGTTAGIGGLGLGLARLRGWIRFRLPHTRTAPQDMRAQHPASTIV